MNLKLFKPDFKNDKKDSDPDFWYFNRYMRNNKLKQVLRGEFYKKNRKIKEQLNRITLFKNKGNQFPERVSNEDNSKTPNDTQMKNRKTINSNSISITKGSFMITSMINKLSPTYSEYSTRTRLPFTKKSHQVESSYQDGHCSELNDTYANPPLLPYVFQLETSRVMADSQSTPKIVKSQAIVLNDSNALFEKLKRKYKFYLPEDNFFEKGKWKRYDEGNESNASSKNILKNSVQCLKTILQKEKKL